MISLLKTNNGWVVEMNNTHSEYRTIEQAADFLISLGKVDDDEIDEALMQMALYDKDKALFTMDGKFKETVSAHDN